MWNDLENCAKTEESARGEVFGEVSIGKCSDEPAEKGCEISVKSAELNDGLSDEQYSYKGCPNLI